MPAYTDKDLVDVVDENDQPLGSFPKAWVGTDLLPAGAKKAGKASSSSEKVEIPEGDPTEDWTNAQLDAFAKAENIDLGGASNTADRLAAIDKSKSTGTNVVTGD